MGLGQVLRDAFGIKQSVLICFILFSWSFTLSMAGVSLGCPSVARLDDSFIPAFSGLSSSPSCRFGWGIRPQQQSFLVLSLSFFFSCLACKTLGEEGIQV